MAVEGLYTGKRERERQKRQKRETKRDRCIVTHYIIIIIEHFTLLLK